MARHITRYLEKAVLADVKRKMVFVGGPRQSGKTTFAQDLCQHEHGSLDGRYLNWDGLDDRQNIMRERFPVLSGMIILDEIHKYSRWRQVVKGLFDRRKSELRILVTGSARLDHYRRGGDSLQGRYHYYRLFPLTLSELGHPSKATLEDLFSYGPFPEPFLLGSEQESWRWSRDYRSRVVREDVPNLERVHDVSLIEQLVVRLPDLVGAPLSLNALREELQVSHESVQRWLTILENLYLIFRILPFDASDTRAVKKEAKHYHYDWVPLTDRAKRFENLVACHLYKWCCYQQDAEGKDVELRYFRDTDKREVDFVLLQGGKPIHLVQCGLSDRDVSPSLRYLAKRYPGVPATQVALDSDADLLTSDDIRLSPAHRFLAQFS